jgi:hypothetical protein
MSLNYCSLPAPFCGNLAHEPDDGVVGAMFIRRIKHTFVLTGCGTTGMWEW